MYIAIDVGGTKISAALIDDDKIVEKRKIPSVIHTDLTNLHIHLFKLCDDWVEMANYLALACTGLVGDDAVNFLSAKLELPLKNQLETAFNLPVTILNDAAAAAWAEYSILNSSAEFGKNESLVYITVSTGVGGGLIQNGQLVVSKDGFCAHLGHTSVHHPSNKLLECHCGRINCVEAISSGTAIATQASQILNKSVSCKEVFEQYAYIEAINEIISDSARAVSDLIANMKAATGASHFILGGSVGSASIFYQKVQQHVSHFPSIYQLTLSPPQCGADADLLGAYWYAKSLTTT